MNKLKFARFLFILSIVLVVVFCSCLLFDPQAKDNIIGRIGLWCGFISQFLLAVVEYSEIRRIKKGTEQ